MSYDERKAAEAAAYLLQRAGGSLAFIKLLKLMYLAERLSFLRYGVPLTGDHFVSMKNGPVLSETYDHIKGEIPSAPGGWDSWVKDQADYMVGLPDDRLGVRPDQLEELSYSDIELLDEVWCQYGHMDRWDLVRLTHDLPEWEHPGASSRPIKWHTLFRAIGYSDEAATALEKHLRDQSALDRHFA